MKTPAASEAKKPLAPELKKYNVSPSKKKTYTVNKKY
jgi:hypothetical protein